MKLLITLLTSGGVKWLLILIMMAGLTGSLYIKHREIVDQEKQIALQQYNIKQLEQSMKDKQNFIEQLQTISRNKDEIISTLQKQREALDNKLKAIESDIDVEVGKGNDRSSSSILKDTIRKLSQ